MRGRAGAATTQHTMRESRDSPQTVRLSRGRHRHPREGACVMELASMLAGERFTDHPASVCPLIAALARVYNDRAGDERRQDLLAVASLSVGTADERTAELRRLEHVERWARARFPRWRFVKRATVTLCARAGDYEGLAGLVVRAAGRSADGHRALLRLFEELAAMAIRPQVPLAYAAGEGAAPAPEPALSR